MKEEDIYFIIENYLTGKLNTEDRSKFISKMKNDVDILKKTEVERGMKELFLKEEKEKLELAQRFTKKYTSAQKSAKLIEFNEKKDNRILDYMNAAYSNNIDLLGNNSEVIDWETIVKFLDGGNTNSQK